MKQIGFESEAMNKPKTNESEDSDEYLAAWADNLAEAVSIDELRELQRRYARKSRDMKATADDRRFARKRAGILRELL